MGIQGLLPGQSWGRKAVCGTDLVQATSVPSLPVPAILNKPTNYHRFNSENGLFKHEYFECYFGARDFSHTVCEPSTSAILYFPNFHLSDTKRMINFMGEKKSHKHSVDFSIQIHQDNLHSGSEAIFELKAVCEKGKNTVLSHGKKSFKLVAVTGQKLCVFFREMPGAVFEFLQQGGVHCFTALTDYWFAAASQEPSLTTCDSWWQMLDR